MYKVANSKNNQSVADENKPLQLISKIIPLENFKFQIQIIHPNSNEVIFDEEDQFQSINEASIFAKNKKNELSKKSEFRTFYEKKTYVLNGNRNKMDKNYE